MKKMTKVKHQRNPKHRGYRNKGKNKMTKTLKNTKASQAKDNVKDIKFYGDGDLFKCLSKAWSEAEGWMKSTKAMEVPGGVVIQVSTQQGDNVAEALTFVPGASIEAHQDGTYRLVTDRY